MCRLTVDGMTSGPDFLDSTTLRRGSKLYSFAISRVNLINECMSLRWLRKESRRFFPMSPNG